MTTADPDEAPPAEIGPTPTCGDASHGPTGGCPAWEFGCVGWAGLGNLNATGHCLVAPTTGSVQASVDGAGFVASQVVSYLDGSTIGLSARLGDAQVVLFVPATIGVHDCAGPYSLAGIAYFAETAASLTTDFRSVTVAGIQPVCSVTVTDVGDVGQPLVGSFAATLVQWRYDPASGPPATLALANGSFSVVRAATQ